MSMNELQSIARVLGIKADVDDKTMCLLIQDKIKEKDKQVKKKDFNYYMVKAQNERLKSEIKNLHNEFAESIGIQEHMMLKNSYKTLKKDYNKVLEDRHNLRKTIDQYRDAEFKDRLNRIVGVR